MILTLPYPVSANVYWRSRVIVPKHGAAFSTTYVSPEAIAYKRDVRMAAYEQGWRKPLDGRVSLAIRLYPHRPQDWLKRFQKSPEAWDDTVQCIDLDNALKVLIDALKGIAFRDDAWVRELSAARMEPDALGERVLVSIEPIVRAALQLVCPICRDEVCPGPIAHPGHTVLTAREIAT